MADATGFEKLGALLGGGAGNVREEAYQEGRLMTARTEDAIARARTNQLEGEATILKLKGLQEFEDNYVAANPTKPGVAQEAKMLGSIIMGEAGSDFKAGMEGIQVGQETDNRAILSDPGADPAKQWAAGQGVQGKVLNPLEDVGAGGYTNLRTPGDELLTTPLGDSMIFENEQSGKLSEDKRLNPERHRAPASASGGIDPASGLKLPPNMMPNPAFDPTQLVSDDNQPFLPIPGATQQGAIEQRFQSRIQVGANSAVKTIKNIVDLPAGASTGLLGVGQSPGQSIFQAGLDNLRNKVSSQEVQSYNSLLTGLDRNLAVVEGAGQIASDALAGSYDTLQLRETDTQLTRLRKLAEMKQTVTAGIEPHLHNMRIPRSQRDFYRMIIDEVNKLIPFDQSDVAALEQAENPQQTLGDVIKARGLADPQAAAPAEAGAEAPAEAGGETIEAIVMKNGDGKMDPATGDIVREDGWILMRDGKEVAWVNPANPQEFEMVAQ